MNTLNPSNPVGGSQERSGENLAIRKSKLTQILEGLNSREDLFIATVVRNPNSGSGWSETIDVIVAPKNPIYDPDGLNGFMKSLVPEVKPTSIDLSTHYDEKSDFSLGKLYFDEELAKVQVQIKKTTIITTCDETEFLGITEGTVEESKEQILKRRTW